jgi:periplasmic protein CpxP/Spy
MKRIAMAVAVLLAAGVVLAQGPPDPAQMAERQLTAMKERLKLTADQEKQIKPILLDAAKKNAEMRQKMEPGQPPSEEMMAAMKKSRAEQNTKIDAILTDEQKPEYQKMQSERKGGGQGKRQKQ